MKELIKIQTELRAPKNQVNSFGNYNYRSCEDILEAVKPLLEKNKCTLTLSDTPVLVGTWNYIEAKATIKNSDGEEVTTTAYARESESKRGMDTSQITGTASSYARKYCLNGLFLIDDAKDADTNEHKQTMDNSMPRSGDAINSEQAKRIDELIESQGRDREAFLEYYKIKNTTDMTVEQYADAVKLLSKQQNKTEIKA